MIRKRANIEEAAQRAKDVPTEAITETFLTADVGTCPLLETVMHTDEKMVRGVFYLTEKQSKFVKSMAKKYGIKESEVARAAIKLLMQNGK